MAKTPANDLNELVERRIHAFINQDLNRVPYLIMTLFGDSVLPHGGQVWTGSLVQLLEPLGINERLVRTSIFRLVKEGWLSSIKKGRKSYYQACRTDEIATSDREIYNKLEKWDGSWRLIFSTQQPDENQVKTKETFVRQLSKNGFISPSSSVYCHPTFPLKRIKSLLEQFEMSDYFIVLNARPSDELPYTADHVLMNLASSELDALKLEYQRYLDQYQSIFNYLDQVSSLVPEHCFLLRSLMINDYRRLLWHDKLKSILFMSNTWVAHTARDITGNIYLAIEKKSREYFQSVARNHKGSIDPMGLQYYTRFKYLV